MELAIVAMPVYLSSEVSDLPCHCFRLAGRRPVARPVGTTVRVEGLFEALPVRRGDFVRYVVRNVCE